MGVFGTEYSGDLRRCRYRTLRWRQFTAGTHQDLYAVYGSGLNKLFLAGLDGTLIRFEGNAWHCEFTGVRADLHGLASHGETFFAVGSAGTVLRNEDGLWEPELAPVETTLQTLAVACMPRAAMVCCSGGLVTSDEAGRWVGRSSVPGLTLGMTPFQCELIAHFLLRYSAPLELPMIPLQKTVVRGLLS